MEKLKNIKKSYLTAFIVGIAAILVGTSYAVIYQLYIKGTDIGIGGTSSSFFEGMQGLSAPVKMMMFSVPDTAMQLKLETTGYINASNIVLIKESDVADKAQKGRFRITNEEYSDTLAYSITLSKLSISPNLQVEDFKWQLYDYNNQVIVNSGTFNNVSTSSLELLTYQDIAPRTAHQYELRLWIQENELDQTNLMNGSFSGKIKISAFESKGEIK